MNLAWGGIVILVLLLPGFLFFVGLYFPERFTRQLAERSALGQLAGTVLVAFLVHGLLFAINQSACTSHCISLPLLLSLITISQPGTSVVESIAGSLTSHPWAILSYNLLAASLGLGLGIATGIGVVRGHLRFLAQHTWLYSLFLEERPPFANAAGKLRAKYHWVRRYQWLARLAADGDREVTAAYVLTTVAHEGRVLLYRGYLKAFGIRSDGTFTYV